MSLQKAITYLSKFKYFNFKYLSFADKNKAEFYNDKQLLLYKSVNKHNNILK